MEQKYSLKGVLRMVFTIAVLANVFDVIGQSDKGQIILIPDSINKVFQTSCMPCHSGKDGRLPASRLNFSRWAAYGAAKEAEKASMICTVLTKGQMPPKSARKSYPELIPTEEQTQMICKWAGSIESLKKKKK